MICSWSLSRFYDVVSWRYVTLVKLRKVLSGGVKKGMFGFNLWSGLSEFALVGVVSVETFVCGTIQPEVCESVSLF